MADKAVQELERIYTIPLRAVKSSPRNHQADRAVRLVKKYLARHMKAEEVWIDASVNEAIWARGMYQTPSRIRVRARKFDDGVVEVSLPDVEVKESIRGEIKARQEKAQEGKETKEEEEEEEGEKKEKKAEAEKKPKAGPAGPADAATQKEAAAAPAEARKATPWSQRKVIDIEGVGPGYDAKLAGAGIRLMDQLVVADADAVSKKTGISLALVKTWQGMADLDRLDTVNNQYAELLVRAGIDRIEQLAKETPEAVVTRVNAYLATVERPPTTQAVTEAIAAEWIKEARRFTRPPGTGGGPAKA